ncbi:MAG: hypothetical protein J5I90_14750 [Caldilineales bacterium]|nr:hypothetical protein [Caldilineales bacterium]
MARQGKVELWWVQCEDHSHTGEVYILAGDRYGRRLGKTVNKEYAEFDFMADSVVDEVLEIANMMGMEQEYPARSDCIESLLRTICDPAPSGQRYDFLFKVSCPSCSSLKIRYAPYDPPRFKIIDMPLATHVNWDNLTQEAKTQLVFDTLKRVGCLKN